MSRCPYCKCLMHKWDGGVPTLLEPMMWPFAETIDHIIPRSRFNGYPFFLKRKLAGGAKGKDGQNNKQKVCYRCNVDKGHLDPEEYRAWLEGNVTRLDRGPGQKEWQERQRIVLRNLAALGLTRDMN